MEENVIEQLNHCTNDSLVEGIYDLPYIPLFLVSIIISPWRIFFWTKDALSVPETMSYKEYINLQSTKRYELFDTFIQALLDLTTVLWMILSVLYLWRIPFFIRVSYHLIQCRC